mmetsp:Transcript_27040/g.30160  ORF Transcript_27040/g.30160 Transcript_27040/m.30160 type:complete len:294 (+) Transcript_27040:88-969(+)|eukprot:CAMPEP_0168539268 /NCGR_PEP_ID=MMETSP0405-20121227/21722_1 /TAXON_ID=498012 /ORGANISM="Trichosphaerium sp, Strain Am-I-7 wt" /LENGTH=293 /DNA_ID=CAMNT_0008568789 /DNA_START=60 /DNA_END=941 /DNA_ORIENTATION=+
MKSEFRVRIVEVTDLPKYQGKKPNTYVEAAIIGDYGRTQRTSVKQGECNPIFDNEYKWRLKKKNIKLRLTVRHKNNWAADKSFGNVEITIMGLKSQTPKECFFKLPHNQGTIHCVLTWSDLEDMKKEVETQRMIRTTMAAQQQQQQTGYPGAQFNTTQQAMPTPGKTNQPMMPMTMSMQPMPMMMQPMPMNPMMSMQAPMVNPMMYTGGYAPMQMGTYQPGPQPMMMTAPAPMYNMAPNGQVPPQQPGFNPMMATARQTNYTQTSQLYPMMPPTATNHPAAAQGPFVRPGLDK